MEHINNKPIGIFDSGVGGLTVFKEIRKKLPGENILYLGDTARVPYGIRSAQTVIKYSIANTDFLLKQSIKLLVIACNTASAVATDTLKSKYTIPIVDVVGPGARRAVAITKNKRIGIIGTEGTIRSTAYEKEIKRLQPDAVTFTQSCPLFVPLAEEGWCDKNDEVVLIIAERYLKRLKTCGIDTLVLGCTHYPLLKEAIQEVVGRHITLIDSAEETAHEVARMLTSGTILNTGEKTGLDLFCLTDIPHRFTETGKLFLGREVANVSVVDLM
ncbi:MAG: glutamate racemase [Pseudomonadota bacterium]